MAPLVFRALIALVIFAALMIFMTRRKAESEHDRRL